MSTLGNYILRGTVAIAASLLITEVAATTIEAVKIRKQYLKCLEEDPEVTEEHYKDCKSGKKAAKLALDCMKEAARRRVERIKKDPRRELTAAWGCISMLFGYWKGTTRGFKNGYDASKTDIDSIFAHLGKYVPKELTQMMEAIKAKGPGAITTSTFVNGETLLWHEWDPAKVVLPTMEEKS